MRVLDVNALNEHGLNKIWVQENHSCNTRKGIVRGLHFQFPPFTETKLVRAISGEVMDVFVDLREGSPTFGKWDWIILSDQSFNAIYIPRGFAHGFCTLTDHSEIIYKVDNYYSKDHESGIMWNDPDISIEWRVSKQDVLLSERDRSHSSLKEFLKEHRGISQY
jgi:dTDP-4-dehydrorhamnose 3,5-epimerase